MNKQNQRGGDNSTNVQAETVKVSQGLSYSDARQVAVDVFQANFQVMANEALEVANERRDRITDKILNKMLEENPDGFEVARDVDFQHSLFVVQKEFAKTGDEDLGDLLVDLLADRSKETVRNLKQIVLNESLSIAPKLTKDQLSALALIFVLRYTKQQIANAKDFGEYLDSFVKPFMEALPASQAGYQHLQFTGCGSINTGQFGLAKNLKNCYRGLFSKGVTIDEINAEKWPISSDDPLFIPCLNNPEKLQLSALNEEVLDTKIHDQNIDAEFHPAILNIFNRNLMTNDEIEARCAEIRPYMSELFETWSSTEMRRFSLTSVGIAIAHANVKRLNGEFADLSIWIS